jgi:C4-dicarboxylate transporter
MKNLVRILFTTKTGQTILAAWVAGGFALYRGDIGAEAFVISVFVGIQQLAQRHATEKAGK